MAKVRAICDVTSIDEGWGHVHGTLNLIKQLIVRGYRVKKLEVIPVSAEMGKYAGRAFIATREYDDCIFEGKVKEILGDVILAFEEFSIVDDPNETIEAVQSKDIKKFDLCVSGGIDRDVIENVKVWNEMMKANFGCITRIIITPPGFTKSVVSNVKSLKGNPIPLQQHFLKSSSSRRTIKASPMLICVYKPMRCSKVLTQMIKAFDNLFNAKGSAKTDGTQLKFSMTLIGPIDQVLKEQLTKTGIELVWKESLSPELFKDQLLNSNFCVCEGQNTAAECVSYGVPVVHTPISDRAETINGIIKERFTLDVASKPDVNNITALIQCMGEVEEWYCRFSQILMKFDILDEALKIAKEF